MRLLTSPPPLHSHQPISHRHLPNPQKVERSNSWGKTPREATLAGRWPGVFQRPNKNSTCKNRGNVENAPFWTKKFMKTCLAFAKICIVRDEHIQKWGHFLRNSCEMLRKIPAFYRCVLWKTKQTRTFLGIVEAMFFQQSHGSAPSAPNCRIASEPLFVYDEMISFVIYRWVVSSFNPLEKHTKIKMGRNLPQLFGVKVQNMWNHHPVMFLWLRILHPSTCIIDQICHQTLVRLQVEQLNCEMGDPLNDTPFFNVKSKLLVDLYL